MKCSTINCIIAQVILMIAQETNLFFYIYNVFLCPIFSINSKRPYKKCFMRSVYDLGVKTEVLIEPPPKQE